jgi:serine protease Do
MRISIKNLRLVAGSTGVGLAFAIVLILAFAAAVHAATLDPAVLPKVEAATFEVVQAKPDPDPLTYEKPLPLDLLPYQERTDKYYSIGTAFAIGKGRYVTAAHVLLAGADSLWGPPALRDSKGKVYPIDKIEKFGLRRDFVVFSLATQPGDAALEIDGKPGLNDVVYAVGNALGTGVVIRDGLYTSDTPEQQDGAWKWMRFSAAASPGNSGGPLLDRDGKVIGVVLAKSPNENLNYALPIQQVLDAPDNQAVLDERTSYSLDVLDGEMQSDVLEAKFTLPLSLADFYRNYDNAVNKHEDAQQQALLAREAGNLFPAGAGSARLLYHIPPQILAFPALVARNSNGEWALAQSNTNRIELEDNGFVDMGALGHNVLFHIRRPDRLNPNTFYHDPKLRMDLLMKTGLFKRPVGSDSVKITSLGKPESESEYVDRWQRRWQTGVWTLPFLNARVVAYTLPTPDGCVVMLRPTPAMGLHDTVLDFNQLTNFVFESYAGTLAQWKQYLGDASLLPGVFKNIRIDVDYDHRFSYSSQRVAFSYTPELQAITPNGYMELAFMFFPEADHAVWDVADVRIWKDKANNDYDRIAVPRYHIPPPGLDDDLTSAWQKVLKRQHPADGVARNDDDVMTIVAVAGSNTREPSVLYTAFYGIEGDHPQDFMKGKLDLLMKGLQVKEH